MRSCVLHGALPAGRLRETGTTIAGDRRRMKKLEARFYPPVSRNHFIVIAHIFIPTEGEDRKPRIRPTRFATGEGSPASLLSTLKYLVHSTAPYTWDRLIALRSRYWSFAPVQLSAAERSTEAALVRDA
jgi:hypothetical protein